MTELHANMIDEIEELRIWKAKAEAAMDANGITVK